MSRNETIASVDSRSRFP